MRMKALRRLPKQESGQARMQVGGHELNFKRESQNQTRLTRL